jgi:hypothetical protein
MLCACRRCCAEQFRLCVEIMQHAATRGMQHVACQMACNTQHGKRNMQRRCSLPFCLRVEIVPPEKAKKQELGLKLTFNVVNLAGATKQHSAVKEGSFAQARRCTGAACCDSIQWGMRNGVLSSGYGHSVQLAPHCSAPSG